MHYTVSYQNPLTQYVQLSLEIDQIDQDVVELQMPAWRPGRYMLQHFAKNVRSLTAWTDDARSLEVTKVTKDRWIVFADQAERITVRYDYWCCQLDAGGCWLDDEQLYLNWICCGLQVIGREDEPYHIRLRLPDAYRVATPLRREGDGWKAANFDELADSPMLASDQLQMADFEQSGCHFYLWVKGNVQMDWPTVIAQFKAYTQVQVELFGGQFPTDHYHYIYQILPYRKYHGVEHQRSTVIVLGPDRDWPDKLYADFLGVSSHELFHTWNVTRLRSREMVPYDYSRENYFETGFVAEGFTTYYGDLMLSRAQVFDTRQYLNEINLYLSRHFNNLGRFHTSLADTSFDLWLDGYTSKAPGRGVSIYIKGALVSLILDMYLRKNSQNRHSLDDVMRLLWERHLSMGFLMADLQDIFSELGGEDVLPLFDELIFGTTQIEEYLRDSLDYVGLELVISPPAASYAWRYGLLLKHADNAPLEVSQIAPKSPAEQHLMLGDRIVAVNGKELEKENAIMLFDTENVSLDLIRHGRTLRAPLQSGASRFWGQYSVRPKPQATPHQQANFQLWCGNQLQG